MEIKTFEGIGRQKVRKDKPFTNREVVDVIVKHPTLNKYLIQKNNNYDYIGFVRGGIEDNETSIIAGIRELKEETGYINVELLWIDEDKLKNTFKIDSMIYNVDRLLLYNE